MRHLNYFINQDNVIKYLRTYPYVALFIFMLFYFPTNCHAQKETIRVIMIGAHPDDCDQKGGGMAALFSSMGHAVKFLSVTNGDAGHQSQGGGILAKRRAAEAQESAKRLGITYEVMGNPDGELMPTLDIRLNIIRKIREWNADIVIAPRPNDYHPDHRYTGILVQDAAYMVAVPNIASDVPALKKNPLFLYFKDDFQRPNPFRPDVTIDITNVYEQKIKALDAHVSQFYEWLPWIAGYEGKIPIEADDRINFLKKFRPSIISPEEKNTLMKWYKKEGIDQIKFVESFEICEFGLQPNNSDIRRLFPMLPVN